MTSSQYTISLYNSRKNLIDLLHIQGYDISDYEGFSINEVDAMHTNGQMDMLLTHRTLPQKAYIKYAKHIRQANLDVFVDDLYYTENVLNKATDILIIVSDDEPNECIMSKLEYLFNHDGIFIVIHNIRRLQYNLLNHALVPKTRILTEPETKDLFHKYSIKDNTQLPEISRFDPLALALGMKPGQVCEHVRNSNTALETLYYRICV
jgi:DNA-directed RNA polymerase subunit H (RpoH/RPB5)